MKKNNAVSLPAVGGSSLLVVFCVLCLTVFALLSLSTVQAEKRLSDKAAQAVADYYRADLEAETVFARLRAGENLPDVQVSDGLYRYQCPVSEHQILLVELQKDEDQWTVLRWQTVTGQEALDQSLPVWDGK